MPLLLLLSYKNYYGACSQWNSQGKCIICLDSAAFTGYYSIVDILTRQCREYIEYFSFSRKCRTYFLPHDLITLERPITIITQNVDGLSDVRHLTLLRVRENTQMYCHWREHYANVFRLLTVLTHLLLKVPFHKRDTYIPACIYVQDCKRVRKGFFCFSFFFFFQTTNIAFGTQHVDCFLVISNIDIPQSLVYYNYFSSLSWKLSEKQAGTVLNQFIRGEPKALE